MQLKELQKQFVEFVYSHKLSDELLENIKSLSKVEALQTYKNSSIISLVDAMKITFHSVFLTLGDKKFVDIVKKFVFASPPKEGDLNVYGKEFPEFLKDNLVESFFCLDLAMLDLKYNQIYDKADFIKKSVDEFKSISPEKYEGIKFKINPTLELLDLNRDVLNYWKQLRSSEKTRKNVKIENKENTIIMLRHQSNNICSFKISYTEKKFVTMCRENAEFFDIFEKLTQEDPKFDLQIILKKFIEKQIIVSF